MSKANGYKPEIECSEQVLVWMSGCWGSWLSPTGSQRCWSATSMLLMWWEWGHVVKDHT